jgi:hypothetical protein
MAILVACVLGLVALAYVLYPIYHQKAEKALPGGENGENSKSSETLHAVLEQEQAARNALQEVELDYQLDNISEEDYNHLRERYIRRAAVALKARFEQERARDQELDAAIEAQLNKLKEQERNEETAE